MAITSLTSQQFGNLVIATATSDLVGTAYFYWWLEGVFRTVESAGQFSVWVADAGQAHIACADAATADVDPATIAPDGLPATRTAFWLRTVAADAAAYRLEKQAEGGDWETVETIYRDDEAWSYSTDVAELEDLTAYALRVVPIDAAGNDGTAVSLDAELIVRVPNAPRWTVSVDSVTGRATFSLVT